MKKIICIVFITVYFLSFVSCSNKENIADKSESIFQVLESTKIIEPSIDIFDYIPFIENSIYEFQGCFFTNSTSFKSRYITENVNEYDQNIKTIKITAQNDNLKGDFESYADFLCVYNDLGIYRYDLDFEDRGIYMSNMERYLTNYIIDENYANSTQDNPMVYYPIIKMPLEIGATWEIPFNQNNHYGQIIQNEITGIDIPIETLLGKLYALEVTKKIPNGYYEKHYYVKNIGLIMSKYGDYDPESNEFSDNPYTIEYLTTIYDFNREYNGQFYKDLYVFKENEQLQEGTKRINNLYENYIDNLKYLDEMESEIKDAYTTINMIETRENALYYWDIELNKIYALLKEKLSSDEFDKLKIEQRQWIKDRDDAANDALSHAGTIANVDYVDVLFLRTKQRTIELIQMYFDK